ncbi:hypothetical protein ACFYZE_20845 [Streptomyces sp. NPDC001796]|uniref:hypothetical protein n=1 Tax=Streptomyces sp. NPDC001796 TaxID=3364609 RepID=UPI003698CED9
MQERSNAIRHDRAVNDAMLLATEGVESHVRGEYLFDEAEIIPTDRLRASAV